MSDRVKQTNVKEPVKATPSQPAKAKKAATAKPAPSPSATQRAAGAEASRHIDEKIRSLGDWRGQTLAEVRRIILSAAPEIIEEWKWRGTPVWSHSGNLCTGEVYQAAVKLTFPRGASLDDPDGLFNASLDGNTRRAIDIREGEPLPAAALKRLVRSAIAANENGSRAKTKTPSKMTTKKTSAATAPSPGRVILLSGGNPQIAKGDGDAPVQAYIAAMPGWKSDLGRRLDDLIMRTVPHATKAVRWNSPFYGVEGQGWFLSFHVLTRYVKVTFFDGMSLRPIPPGGTVKSKEARWLDIYEEDVLNEEQMASWVLQASKLPGWTP